MLLALVVACSSNASAHEVHGGGGRPVGFVVVVAFPVLAGLAGGLAAAFRRADAISVPHAGTAFGVALVALGLAVLLPAIADAPMVSVVLAICGAIAAHVLLGRGTSHRGDAALGAVGAHRFVEGATIAIAYGVGTAVGAFGAVVLAGHAAVEAAVIGGIQARTARSRALVAVAALQASFVLGALVGASALPSSDPVRVAALAVAGGVLLVVGPAETGWTETEAVGRWQAGNRLR